MTDNELAAWARNWHWQDCAEDKPVDPSIYFRDLRLLKAFMAARTSLPAVDGNLRTKIRDLIKYCEWQIDNGPYHPTLPSALSELEAALAQPGTAGETKDA